MFLLVPVYGLHVEVLYPVSDDEDVRLKLNELIKRVAACDGEVAALKIAFDEEVRALHRGMDPRIRTLESQRRELCEQIAALVRPNRGSLFAKLKTLALPAGTLSIRWIPASAVLIDKNAEVVATLRRLRLLRRLTVVKRVIDMRKLVEFMTNNPRVRIPGVRVTDAYEMLYVKPHRPQVELEPGDEFHRVRLG